MTEVARASSMTPGKTRWTELEVRRLRDGYELSVTGASDVEGEWDRTKTRVCHSPRELITALRSPGGGLSRLAQQVLDRTASWDTDLRNELEGGTDADPARGSRRRREDDPR